MENDSEVKRSSIVAIGERLRDAREKKNLSIEQVRKQTRIHTSVLTALEEGRCDDILTPTYVKGFLKAYSSYLGLDAGGILKEYAAIYHEAPAHNLNIIKDERCNRVDYSTYFHIARSFIITLLVVFISVVSVKAAARYFRKRKEARPVPAASAKSQKSVVQSIPKNVPLAVVLKIKQPVLVQLRKDGVLLFKRVLSKGTIESFTADNSINIYCAKAEAIELVLNGKHLGSPGRGVIKNLEITRKGIKIK